MGMPDQKKILEIAKAMESVEGTLALSPNATPIEKFRFSLQQEIVRYKRINDLSGTELAEILKVDKSKVSKILKHRLKDFSTDRLLKYVNILYPAKEFNIAG